VKLADEADYQQARRAMGHLVDFLAEVDAAKSPRESLASFMSSLESS
jgi:hypothetical protein